MNTSILWNGFEIKKGTVTTSVGEVPYLCYAPECTKEVVNIAIHGEGHDKDDWLCFNSSLKLGNLLKTSIQKNSAFIAFDLYGHGNWIIDDKHFNIVELSEEDTEKMIKNSRIGIEEAIPKVLEKEHLTDNPIAISSFSLGCSVSLGLTLPTENCKSVLISPLKSSIDSNCKDYLVIHGKSDHLISEIDFNDLFSTLPKGTVVETYNSDHEVPICWIHSAKSYIYSYNNPM